MVAWGYPFIDRMNNLDPHPKGIKKHPRDKAIGGPLEGYGGQYLYIHIKKAVPFHDVLH